MSQKNQPLPRKEICHYFFTIATLQSTDINTSLNIKSGIFTKFTRDNSPSLGAIASLAFLLDILIWKNITYGSVWFCFSYKFYVLEL